MKLGQLINQSLLEGVQKLAGGKKGVLVLDIDDTLVTAQNIFIHKIMPDGKVIKLTPEQFAKDPDKSTAKEKKIQYSIEEFRDPVKVRNSIVTGIPIIKNLRIMDDHINSGWDIAILTARGLEDVIFKSLSKFLMFRNPEGELKEIKDILVRGMVHAINDEAKIYKGTTDFEKKAIVITQLAEKYDHVKFVDDDVRNVEAVKGLKLKNVQVIKAWGKGDK